VNIVLLSQIRGVKMDLHYLKIFDAVARHESFTLASKDLKISQPALSIQVKRFEDELGLKLFNRIGNRIKLNENGQVLYRYSQAIFDMVAEAEYALQHNLGRITGTVNVGASNTPGTYILPKVIADYRKKYPDVNINLHVGNTSDIAQLVNNGSLDFAINGGKNIYHKDVVVEEMMQDELILITSPDTEYASLEQVDNEILKELEFVVHQPDSQLYEYYKSFIESRDLPERVSISLGSIDAIKHAIFAKIGVSLVPYTSVEVELNSGLLTSIPVPGDVPKYPYSLIYHCNKYLSPPAVKFISLLRDYFTITANNKGESTK
jgi:DNA-binding transcriptional LysR family regulator